MRETQNTNLKLNSDKAKIKRANSRGAGEKRVQQTLWEPREKHCTNPVFVKRQNTQNINY